jgi:hypothetical protein
MYRRNFSGSALISSAAGRRSLYSRLFHGIISDSLRVNYILVRRSERRHFLTASVGRSGFVSTQFGSCRTGRRTLPRLEMSAELRGNTGVRRMLETLRRLQPNSTRSRYLPPPAAPDWMASRNRVTLIEPDTWLGGYSLNVARNCPTICTAGTIVHNLSPHQRAYISDSLW